MEVERPSLSPWVGLVIGALALFGLVAMVQWVIGAVLGLIRLALVVAVILAVAALVMRSRAD